MRVLGITRADESTERGVPPNMELVEKMGALMEEIAKAGVLVSTDGLMPSRFGKRMSLKDGKLTVTDGPFSESKELIASYALFEVKSMEEAQEWTRRFLECLGSGECELRPIISEEDFGKLLSGELMK